MTASCRFAQKAGTVCFESCFSHRVQARLRSTSDETDVKTHAALTAVPKGCCTQLHRHEKLLCLCDLRYNCKPASPGRDAAISHAGFLSLRAGPSQDFVAMRVAPPAAHAVGVVVGKLEQGLKLLSCLFAAGCSPKLLQAL